MSRKLLGATLGLALLVLPGALTAQAPAPAPAAPAAPAAPQAPRPPQDPSTRTSPMSVARLKLGDAYLRVNYSRPAKRGRDNIFGTKESKALVPYGEVWRTGANEGTEITVTRDVLIGGQKLPAGTYTIFTVPGPEQWTVHFNSEVGLWGSAAYDKTKDVVVVSAAPWTLPTEVEWFTVALEKTGNGADLVFSWVTTGVRVPVALP
jgi:hypothetical protein